MKWYSVKKYKPCTDYGGKYIVRSESSHSLMYFARWEIFPEKWIDTENQRELLHVTHFCIPDPIEIEE